MWNGGVVLRHPKGKLECSFFKVHNCGFPENSYELLEPVNSGFVPVYSLVMKSSRKIPELHGGSQV
jgi:hypothetical protein